MKLELEPMEKLWECLNEALFYYFRETCKKLRKADLGEIGVEYRCSHRGNRFIQKNKPGLPNCAHVACPIFKEMPQASGPEQQWDLFVRRFEGLPK